MQRTYEREVKLDPDEGFALPELPGRPLASRIFTSTYYDTPARSLARAGITIRRRVENGLSRWQLKLPRDGHRDELEAPGGPAGPPPQLAALLTAHLRHGRLEPVATLRTRRVGVRVASGDRAVADVVLDHVDILDAGHAAGGFAELEVELIEGDDRDLERLARVLRRAGAHRSRGTPKVLRVLDLEELRAPAEDAQPVEHIRHFLAEQLRALEADDPGVRLGDDVDAVHRLRIATRRGRALIRATKPFFGDGLAPLSAELRWLTGLLGPVRDLDVLLERLRLEVACLDADRGGGDALISLLEDERAHARGKLLAGLDDARYLALLAQFDETLQAIPPVPEGSTLDELVARELRRLRRRASRLPELPSDSELHDLRKTAKHVRYAAELASLTGAPAMKRFVAAVKEFQDVVGEHQDAVVAEERIRAVASQESAIAAGRLIERERERRLSARRGYPDMLAEALTRARKAL